MMAATGTTTMTTMEAMEGEMMTVEEIDDGKCDDDEVIACKSLFGKLKVNARSLSDSISDGFDGRVIVTGRRAPEIFGHAGRPRAQK